MGTRARAQGGNLEINVCARCRPFVHVQCISLPEGTLAQPKKVAGEQSCSLLTSIADFQQRLGLVAWGSGNALCPINEVNLRRTGLVLGWVTACGQVNHLGV